MDINLAKPEVTIYVLFLGFGNQAGGEMGAVLVSEQTLYLADTQMILPRQQGDVAHQSGPKLACRRIRRQLPLADAVTAPAATVKQLILGDIQLRFGQLEHLMALARRGIGLYLAATIGAAGIGQANDLTVGRAQLG